jgi:salicylate hydroxylase
MANTSVKFMSLDVADSQPASLSILIIGGGISGLSAAIALRRNGHRVTVRSALTPKHHAPRLTLHIQVADKSGLDRDLGAAIHLCPNASGILHH